MNTVWVVMLTRLVVNSDIVLGVYDSKKYARDAEKHYGEVIYSHGLDQELNVYSLELELNKADISDDSIIAIGKEDIQNA